MSDTSLSPSHHGWSSSGGGGPSTSSGRKGSRKVRTGCITCKIRKVKCDEGKPSCLRCVKTGRKCDGYPAVKPRASRINRSPSPIALLETADELRAFDYYRRKSAAVLGGITMDNDEFWSGLVVKLTATEPAVRHAVLALSSLHERVSKGTDLAGKKGINASDFAFGEYGKAIAAVRSWDMNNHGSQPAAIPLLVCVLFVCIEFLMDYDAAAQLHICQGRLILARMANQMDTSSPAMEMVRKILVPIYARLGLASSLFGSRPEQIPLHLTWGQGDVPLELESMKDARNVLYHLIDRGLLFTLGAKPIVYNPETELWQLQMLKAQQDELLANLAKWNSAFTVLKAAQVTETLASKAMQDLLYVYFHASKIWVSTALATKETAFDDHEDNFAAIISYASSSLAASGSLCREDAAFTFETESLPPVYWTSVKCRHPLLRRAAVRLLNRDEMKRRRENLWRGDELVIISSHVIEMEEGRQIDLDYVSDAKMLAEAEGYWHSDVELRVPKSHPPTLKKPTTDFTDEQLRHVLVGGTSLENTDAASPSSVTPRSQNPEPEPLQGIDPALFQSPYGVPEHQRVKNALIGPTKDNGVWLTTFQDPLPGESEWDVKKVFLKLYQHM